MDPNTEQILIVYSANGTLAADRQATADAIAAYQRYGSSVRVRPRIFEVPAGAAPGATLGTELTDDLESSIGAVVFVDELRPNVAYELGFFHGKGRIVLLLTRQSIDSVWRSISDLAGAALEHLDKVDLSAAVHSYLDRLYEDLSWTDPWHRLGLPSSETNMLDRRGEISGECDYDCEGPFGPQLRIASWAPVEIAVGWHLLPGAGFTVVVRGASSSAEFTVYFEVEFRDRTGERKRVWLGLTSTRGTLLVRSEERSFPAQRPTGDWGILAGDFNDLLKQASILGTGPVDYLERVRFRAGFPDQSNPVPVEVCFLRITGQDA